MSMLLCIVTPLAIYMAADSRQFPSGEDNVQKLFLVGKDAIVAHSGIGVIPSGGTEGKAWDAAGEIRQIASKVVPGTFDKQLTTIENRAKSSLAEALNHYPGRLADDAHLAIMFAKRDSQGRAYMAHLRLNVVSLSDGTDRWTHRVEAGPREIVVNGETGRSGIWWDVPKECAVVPSAGTDLSPNAAFNSLAGIIRGVAAQNNYCGQMIGGPIRAAISDAAGVRWISAPF
jgi:hypothetical protein